MKRRYLTSALLIVIFAGTAVVMLRFDSEKGVVHLPNGEKLTLRAITVGTNTTYCYGNPLQKLGSKFPGSLGERLSGGTVGCAEHWGVPTAVFWFLHEGDSTHAYEFQFGIADEEGLEIDPLFSTGFVPIEAHKTGVFVYGGILPRRSPRMTLRLYPAAAPRQTNCLGQLEIPNPVFNKPASWKAESLPTRRTLGMNTISLENLTLFPRSSCRTANDEIIETTVARVRLRANRPPDSNERWLFFGGRHSDPTGAFSGAWFVISSEPEPNILELEGPWEIWPGEKVVKVQALYVRDQSLQTNEVMWLQGLPVPPANPWWQLILRTNSPFGEIMISHRHEAGSPTKSFEFLLWSGDLRFYRYEDASVRGYLLMAGRDNTGRSLQIKDSRIALVEADANSIDLAVGFPAAEKLEFIVEPTLAATNLPPISLRSKQ